MYKILQEKLLSSENEKLVELVQNTEKEEEMQKSEKLITRIINQLKQLKFIFKPPVLKTSLLACCTAFTVTSSYYVFYLWLPEIFQRFAKFEAGSEEISTFCKISSDSSATENILKVENIIFLFLLLFSFVIK